MKFSLPKTTLQRVAPQPVPRQAQVALEKHRAPRIGAVEDGVDPTHFAFGFSVDAPGSLGPFVGAKGYWEGRPERAPEHEASPIIYPRHGWGRRELAMALVERSLASPGAWFIGRQLNTSMASEYVGVANFLRAQGMEHGIAWGRAGWGRLEGADYELRLERLRGALRVAGGDVERALREAGDVRVRDVLWGTYRAAWAVGDIHLFDQQLRSKALPWREAQRSLLAMKIFTEEQVGLLAPWKSLNSIRSEMDEWWRGGLIEHHAGAPDLHIWRVTEKAVEGALKTGIVEPWEASSRLSIRSTQELHDLAVGDTLILAAIQVAKMGGQIEQIRVEPPVRKKGENYPDLSLDIRLGASSRRVDIEVVGTGGGYQGRGKKAVINKGGYRVVVPGFDGNGIRYA